MSAEQDESMGLVVPTNLKVIPKDATAARELVRENAAKIKAAHGTLTVVGAYTTYVAVASGLLGEGQPYATYDALGAAMGTSGTTAKRWYRLGRVMVVAGVKPGSPLWNSLANFNSIMDGGMLEVVNADNVTQKALTEAVVKNRPEGGLKAAKKPTTSTGPKTPTSLPAGATQVVGGKVVVTRAIVPEGLTNPTERIKSVTMALDEELKGRDWTEAQFLTFAKEVKRIMDREALLLKAREAAAKKAAEELAKAEAGLAEATA